MKGNRKRIEEGYGASIDRVLRAFVDLGYTQKRAAFVLGVSTGRIRVWSRRSGLRWPRPTDSLQRYVAQTALRTEYQGEPRTISEIAELAGLEVTTVRKRYDKGLRGDALGEPLRHCGKLPESYNLGWSLKDWQLVLQYAEDKGADAARQYFAIPRGALSAAQRGEWHKLD